MFRGVLRRLLTDAAGLHRHVKGAAAVGRRVSPACVSLRGFTAGATEDGGATPFDTTLLQFLVCPLSKKPLRYEAETNELINEELGIAYPIVGGIPNMIPQEARLIQKDSDPSATPAQE